MKNFVVNVSTKTSKVYLEETSIAVDGENIAGQVIFKFNDDSFIDGIARLEWQNGSNKYFQLMNKVGKTYVLPIKNVMTKEGKMYFQLVITQQAVGEEIPVFKSNQFFVYVEKSINAEGEAPDYYQTWLDTANEKLLEIDNLNIDVTKVNDTATITLTDKLGVEHKTYIYDGQDGRDGRDGVDGKDAKINGVNTLNIVEGENITIEQVGDTLTISGEAGGGGNVDDVKVNGSSVVENKVANVIVPVKVSDLQNDSGFITSTVNNLTNYYTKSDTYTKTEVNTLIGNIEKLTIQVVQELPTTGEPNVIYLVPKTGSTGDVYDEYIYVNNNWEHIGSTEVDLSNYYTKSETNTLLGNKQDTLVSGTNIKTINSSSLLGSGNIDITPKYYINGDYLIYNVTPGQYSITPNSTSNNVKTKLPFNEIAEAISLSYTNDKYLILNIYTTGMAVNVTFSFSQKFTPNYQQNSGYGETYYSSQGNMWVSNLIINYSYSNGTFTVNSINCKGENQQTIGMNNNNAFTPTGDYNQATKKYVDDNVGTKQDALVSGTNIKTINNTSILGSGNINIEDMKFAKWSWPGQNTKITDTNALNDLQTIISYYVANGIVYGYILENCLLEKVELLSSSEPNDNKRYELIFRGVIVKNGKYQVQEMNIFVYTHYSTDEIYDDSSQYYYPRTNVRDYTQIAYTSDLSNYLRKDNTTSYTPTNDYNPATKKYVDDNASTIQVTTLPTASISDLGKIYQYIGTTNANYVNGYFYKSQVTNVEKHLLVKADSSYSLGYTYQDSDILEIKFKPYVDVPYDAGVLGNEEYSGDYLEMHFYLSNMYIGTGYSEISIANAYKRNKEYTIILNGTNDGIIINGENVYDYLTFGSNGTIRLFNYSSNMSFRGEFYYLKITDKSSGTVKKNWEPAVVNNTPCIHETVGDTYIYNDETENNEFVPASTTYNWVQYDTQPSYYPRLSSWRKTDYTTYQKIDDTNAINDFQWILDTWKSTGNIPNYWLDNYCLTNIQKTWEDSGENYILYELTFVGSDGENINHRLMLNVYTYYNSESVRVDSSVYPSITGIYGDYLAYSYELGSYLSKNNTDEYIPSGDYNPATKKYVDDATAGIDLSNYLAKNNTTAYTPTGTYNPATKGYAESYANSLFQAVSGFSFEVVQALPVSPSTTTIYLISNGTNYDMKAYINSAWETIGTTAINIEPTVVNNSASTYTIATLNGHYLYNLGEITALTISATNTFTSETLIYLESGSTATTVSLPDSIAHIGDYPDFTASGNVNTGTLEQNKHYVISILNNVAIWKAY